MATLDDLAAQVAALQAQVDALTSASTAAAKTTLTTPMIHGANFAAQYPTDAMVNLLRRDDVEPQTWGATTGVLSLVHESPYQYSAAFPLMIQLRATDHADATIATAESACTYLLLRNPGNGWGAAMHAEAYHTAAGITLIANLEVKRTSALGTYIGLNIHNDTACSTSDADIALNIQNPPGAGFKRAINMENAGVFLSALNTGMLSIEADGSIVLGYDKAKLTIRPDGNVGLDCGHYWVNGTMQF